MLKGKCDFKSRFKILKGGKISLMVSALALGNLVNIANATTIEVLPHKDSFKIPEGKRIREDDPYFTQISKQWSETLRRGLQELPKPTTDYGL